MAVRTLQSWKEIAQYLGRGVRTVQRWEARCGLPVHRPAGRNRSAVFALEHEIDNWLERVGRLNGSGEPQLDVTPDTLIERLSRLEAQRERILAQLAAVGSSMNGDGAHISPHIASRQAAAPLHKQRA